MARRLDYWKREDTFKWLDQREEQVFARYFDLGSVKTLVEELAPQCNGLAKHTFYAWLHAIDGRWERFEEIRETKAYDTAEEGYEIANNTTQRTANADRLRFEGKMRAAEHQNRNAFGKRPDVQVAVGVGGEWAQALAAVLEPQKRLSDGGSRALPTENGSTRALASGTVLGTASGDEVQPDGEPSHDE